MRFATRAQIFLGCVAFFGIEFIVISLLQLPDVIWNYLYHGPLDLLPLFAKDILGFIAMFSPFAFAVWLAHRLYRFLVPIEKY